MTVPTAARQVARATPWWAAAGAAAAVVADVAFDPAHRHVPLCAFHSAFGWWCPLCGGLRAVDALVHGQVATALADNAVFVLGLPLIALWWIVWIVRARTERGPWWPRYMWLATIAVGVTFTIARNLPFAHALRPA